MAKSALYARFKTNENTEEAGVWVNFGDDVRVRVRRLKSRASQAARAELDKPFAPEIRRGTMPEDKLKELAIKQVARGVIAEWEGVTDADGNALPYTPENAFKVLTDLPEFAEAIIEISMNAENYKAQMSADAEGNS